MQEYDWSRFTKRININAPKDKIYKAWTTQKGMEDWFLRLAEFRSPNGNVRQPDETVAKDDFYRWRWFGYPDEVEEASVIKGVNGKDLLQFGFAKTCTVTVAIKEENGETIVELTQDNIPLDETSKVNYHLGCMEGWTFYLANLKSVMEGGIDLRNKNPELTKVVNS